MKFWEVKLNYREIISRVRKGEEQSGTVRGIRQKEGMRRVGCWKGWEGVGISQRDDEMTRWHLMTTHCFLSVLGYEGFALP